MWRREVLTWFAYPPSSTYRSTERNGPGSDCSWRAADGTVVPHLDDRVPDERRGLGEPGAQTPRRRLPGRLTRPRGRGHPQHLRRPPGIRGSGLFEAPRAEGVEDAGADDRGDRLHRGQGRGRAPAALSAA